MESRQLDILTGELKKHKLCGLYWSDEVEEVLAGEITLEYEPVGDMGIYSRYFKFELSYQGDDSRLAGTSASMRISITSVNRAYDLEKAEAGEDCFHNVCIKVKRDKESIVTCEFRLWDEEAEKYSGDGEMMSLILGMNQ